MDDEDSSAIYQGVLDRGHARPKVAVDTVLDINRQLGCKRFVIGDQDSERLLFRHSSPPAL